VLADVQSSTFGAGVGPRYTTFIFAAEQTGGLVLPVKVTYAFFKSQGPPPDNFFDYSKVYELQVVRTPQCDETLESLGHIRSVDESGKPLPSTDVLRWLDGAPSDSVKTDSILPCYIVRPGNYRVLSRVQEGRIKPATTR
jgi:hypothetical protein